MNRNREILTVLFDAVDNPNGRRVPFDRNHLRDLRTNLGVTPVLIAAACDCSFAAATNWEIGKSRPSPMLLPVVERVLAALEDAA